MRRRSLLTAAGVGLLTGPLPAATQDDAALAALRAGGVVLALRHALAPGSFDPPGFTPGRCETQRNLNDVGRAQARRIGARLRAAGLQPRVVRSSPWCRCLDTATLAFGSAQSWDALGSPRGTEEKTYAGQLSRLQQALREASRPGRGFEVWVTHMFVLADLVGGSVASGEGLVLAAGHSGPVQVLARFSAG